jgi:hypothetical protein
MEAMALSRLACVRLFMTTGILAANAFTIPLAMVPVPITQTFMSFEFKDLKFNELKI